MNLKYAVEYAAVARDGAVCLVYWLRLNSVESKVHPRVSNVQSLAMPLKESD
jgi:hypothetical protein